MSRWNPRNANIGPENQQPTTPGVRPASRLKYVVHQPIMSQTNRRPLGLIRVIGVFGGLPLRLPSTLSCSLRQLLVSRSRLAKRQRSVGGPTNLALPPLVQFPPTAQL